MNSTGSDSAGRTAGLGKYIDMAPPVAWVAVDSPPWYSLVSSLGAVSRETFSGEHGRGVRGRRGHLPEARHVSVTDAPLTSPGLAEAWRAFGKDVVAAQ